MPRFRAVRGCTLFVLALTALAIGATPAFATFPGGNGRIAWSGQAGAPGGTGELYTMRSSDGLDHRQATYFPGRLSSHPDFSPDGTRLAFHSDANGSNDIYVADVDGSNMRRLTTDPGNDMYPSWSPDGRKLLFTSDRSGNFEGYAMNADGSGVVDVTNNPASETTLGWSPDGSRILFASTRTGNDAVFTANADGSGATKVLNEPLTTQDYADWSPDGSRIALTTDRDGNSEIYVVNVDGTGPVRLTADLGLDTMPVWSPDGTRIAFVSARDGDQDVYSMRSNDGGDLRQLTNDAAYDEFPAWQRIPPAPAAAPAPAPPAGPTLVGNVRLVQLGSLRGRNCGRAARPCRFTLRSTRFILRGAVAGATGVEVVELRFYRKVGRRWRVGIVRRQSTAASGQFEYAPLTHLRLVPGRWLVQASVVGSATFASATSPLQHFLLTP